MYTVKIITVCEEHMITEKAGKRGEKVLISVEGENGISVNPKPRKLEGWKTYKAAFDFISKCLEIDMKTGKDSWYQVETI